MLLRRLLPLSALALIVLAPAARGAAVLRRSVEEMTARAPLVVRATAGASHAELRTGRVFTFTELSVTEALKGKPPAKLVVRQPGGEAGGIGQRVAGAATFTPGEEVVLFLEPAKDDPAVYLVTGMSAGKVRLEQRRGGARATRELDGISFHDAPGQPAPKVRPVDDGADLGAADAFLARVRKAARAAQGGTP